MNKARSQMMNALNQTIRENELPAYIMESIVADILGDLRQTARNELLNEMEREHGNSMEQGIQPDKLAE